MCGIAGVMFLSGDDCRILKTLKNMSDSHAVRGPDDEGYYTFNKSGTSKFYFGPDTPQEVRGQYNLSSVTRAESSNAFLGLSHRRLSIIDLTADAHQPMEYSDSRFVIVYNGEIYNYIELRNELIALGCKFRSNSDTEVILAAYTIWREKCVEKFNGDFAFAIWDSTSRMLFCARDRIGIKPFYYNITNGIFLFGSDIKTIIASKLYNPEVSSSGIYYSMAYGLAPRPLTAFKEIYALEPGSTLTINEYGKISRNTYWKVPTNQQNMNLSENDAVEIIENELSRATKLRMRSDVPVGTFMSGGVDSTLITALASKENSNVKAFTLAFNGVDSDYDELEEAKLAANHIGVRHIIKNIDCKDILPKIQEMVRLYEEPYYDLSPTLLISEEVKVNGMKVVLNGLGGDEIFAGYGYYKYHSLPALNLPLGFSRLFQKIKNDRLSRGLQLLSSANIQDLHNIAFRCSNDYHLNNLFNADVCPDKAADEMLAELYLSNMLFVDKIEATCYLDLVNYVGNHFVHRVDQFTMFNSIEGRFPYLDHNVIEAGFAIPSKYKVKEGKLKYIIRKIAQKYIPQECISMKKKGFSLPLNLWMRHELRDDVENNIKNLMTREIVNPDYVKKCYEAYLGGRLSHHKIWHLVSLEMWLKEFFD